MNNVELQEFIRVIQANERLKRENLELREELSGLKKDVAFKAFTPVNYGCTPGNDEVRKEGES